METFLDLPLDLQILTSHYFVHTTDEKRKKKTLTINSLKKALKDQLTAVYYLSTLSEKSLDRWRQSTKLKSKDLSALLHSSVLLNKTESIGFFLDQGARPDKDNGFAYTLAVLMKDESILSSLLVHLKDPEALSIPFTLASCRGNLGMFEILRNKWIDREDWGLIQVSTRRAAANGHLSFVRKLIEEKPDRKLDLESILGCAISSRNVHLVKYLLDQGAIMTIDSFGYCDTLNMTKLLYSRMSSISEEEMTSLLEYCLEHSYINIAKFWVDQGAEITEDILQEIIHFSGSGNLRTLKFLYKYSDEGARYMDEALINAARYNKVDNIRFLLSKGADVHALEEEALRLAIIRGHFESVRFLVMNGADFRIDDFKMMNWAEDYRRKEISEYLYSQAEKQYRKESWFEW